MMLFCFVFVFVFFSSLFPIDDRSSSIRSIFSCPFPSVFVVLLPVRLVQHRDVWDQGVIRIRICEETADGEKNLADGESRTPVVLQDVQTDASLVIDVAVIDLGEELDPRWLERIILREFDVQFEDSILVRTLRLFQAR